MSQEDMNTVLNEGIQAAVHLLTKNGELLPFAVVNTSKGEVRHVQAWSEDPRPTSDCVIQLLRSKLRRAVLSREYRTTAILSAVRLRGRETGEVIDAIRAEVEDIEANPVTCYLPYVLKDGAMSVGEMEAEAGMRVVFAE